MNFAEKYILYAIANVHSVEIVNPPLSTILNACFGQQKNHLI